MIHKVNHVHMVIRQKVHPLEKNREHMGFDLVCQQGMIFHAYFYLQDWKTHQNTPYCNFYIEEMQEVNPDFEWGMVCS